MSRISLKFNEHSSSTYVDRIADVYNWTLSWQSQFDSSTWIRCKQFNLYCWMYTLGCLTGWRVVCVCVCVYVWDSWTSTRRKTMILWDHIDMNTMTHINRRVVNLYVLFIKSRCVSVTYGIHVSKKMHDFKRELALILDLHAAGVRELEPVNCLIRKSIILWALYVDISIYTYNCYITYRYTCVATD